VLISFLWRWELSNRDNKIQEIIQKAKNMLIQNWWFCPNLKWALKASSQQANQLMRSTNAVLFNDLPDFGWNYYHKFRWFWVTKKHMMDDFQDFCNDFLGNLTILQDTWWFFRFADTHFFITCGIYFPTSLPVLIWPLTLKELIFSGGYSKKQLPQLLINSRSILNKDTFPSIDKALLYSLTLKN